MTKAIAEFQQVHAAASLEHRTELTTVTRELKEMSAATDRYLISFERGVLDDADTAIRARLTAFATRPAS